MLITILFLIAFLLISTIAALRAFRPDDIAELQILQGKVARYRLGDEITVLTWNLGYAGLGEESAFFYESKRLSDILPPSKDAVRKNMNGIIDCLSGNPADIILLQEITTRSFMNYNTPMYDEINVALNGFNAAFSESVCIKLLLFKMIHGNAVFSTYGPASIHRHSLPLEKKGWTGFFNQKYNYIVARYDIEGSSNELVVLNAHFAAFDQDGTVRKKQLSEIVAFITTEYIKGNYVIAGGDWNLLLEETDFPYNTPEELLTWRQTFREDLYNELSAAGWAIPVDSSTPTVRSVEKPYDGNNFTTIIDGFICSPNLEVKEVEGVNQGFVYSDHNPVRLRVKPKY